MGKFAPDTTLDAYLDNIAASTFECVCSGSPATFDDAYTNLMLARMATTSGCYVKADDTSGRKLTVSAKTGMTITNSGFAEAVALVDVGNSLLKVVTSCTGQQLTAGGTVDAPSWKINIVDPS